MSPSRPAQRILTRSHVVWATAGGSVLLLLLIGIAWKSTNVLWFLLFPLLLVGVVAAATTAVLWMLRHF